MLNWIKKEWEKNMTPTIKEKALKLGLTDADIFSLYYQIDLEFKQEDVENFIKETYPNYRKLTEKEIKYITQLYMEKRKLHDSEYWIKLLNEIFSDYFDSIAKHALAVLQTHG